MTKNLKGSNAEQRTSTNGVMAEIMASQVAGAIGYSPPTVMKACLRGQNCRPELPTDDTGLLTEVSELLHAADVIQNRALDLPNQVRSVDFIQAAIHSLSAQRERLLPILECDLFEPIYAQLHVACQATGVIHVLEQHGLNVVTEAWKRVIPKTDYWSAMVWASREWKRNRDQPNETNLRSTVSGHSGNNSAIPDDVNEVRRLQKLKRWKDKYPIVVCRHYISQEHTDLNKDSVEKAAQTLKRKVNRHR